MGVLSSVPSQAAIVGDATVTVVNGTATTGKSDSTGAATIAVRYFAEDTNDTASITITVGSIPASAAATNDTRVVYVPVDTATSTNLTVLGGKTTANGAFTHTASNADSQTVASTITTGGSIIPGGSGFAAGKFGYFLDTALVRTVGTYTMNYIVRIYDNATVSTTKVYAGTFTIAVTNSATGAVGSVTAAGTSTAVMTKQGTGEGTDETDLSAVMTPTGAAIANIVVTQKTAAGLPSRESVTVTTSIGNLADAATLAGSTVSGKTLTLESASDGVNTVYLFGDGTSGRAAITIKTTSVTFSAKSAVFYSTTVPS